MSDDFTWYGGKVDLDVVREVVKMKRRQGVTADLWDYLVTRQELVRGDDGMWLYWPTGWNKGALNSSALRSIAARMDIENRKNAERLTAVERVT